MSRWEMVSIPELLFFQEGPGVRNTQYTSSGVKLLNVANLQNGKVDLSTSDRYISEEEAYGKYKHFLVDEGDFIIASSGIQVDYFENKMGFISSSQLPLCMNTSTIRFKSLDNSKLYIKYFMYYLKTVQFKIQLSKFITGSAQLNFGPSHLKQMTFPLPPLPTQQKIADILDRASSLIEKRKAQLEKMDLLVKSQFVEMFGDPVINPRGWEVRLVKEIFKVRSSKRVYQHEQTSYGVPFLRVSDLTNRILNDVETCSLFITESLYDSYKKEGYVPKADDILVTSRGTLGLCYIVSNTDKFYFQDGMISWLGKQEVEVSSDYILCLFCTDDIKQQIEKMSAGSTINYLSLVNLERLNIMFPPLALQNQFAAFVERVEAQKAQMKQGLALMELGYKALMQKCFNGEMF